MSGERTFLTANCSFVTSFPNVLFDPANDQGMFRFGVSDGIAAAKLLSDKKRKQKAIPESEKSGLESIDLDTPTQNQKIVYSLFEDSIDNILENSDENTVVGMQELNNTEQVHNTIQNKLSTIKDKSSKKGRNSFFVCNNVHDPTGGTYATLGYILPGKVDDYVKLKNGHGQIFRNTATNYKYEDIDAKNEAEKIKSYSVVTGKNNIMAIRDLGKASKIEPIKEDSDLYALKGINNTEKPNTDSGRPISMVIRGTQEEPKEIYINCHMINASILNIFEKEEKEEKEGKKVIKYIYREHIGSLLTNSDKEIGTTGKKGKQIWFDYCIKRLQETLNELLSDFGIKNLDESTKVYIMGDFNDPEGTLLKYLEDNTIKMGGQSYKFIFGEKLDTCCPNSNSASNTEKINDVKQKKPFNKGLRDYIENKEVGKDIFALDEAKKIYALTPIFKGDNIGKGYIDGKKQPAKPFVQIIEKKTSDHSFVKTYNTGPKFEDDVKRKMINGGKRRTRRRRRSSGKRRMSRRRRGRRSTRRKR